MKKPTIKVIKDAGKRTEEVLKEFEVGDYDPIGDYYYAHDAIQAAIDFAASVEADTVKLPGIRMKRDA